jgi:hypothetical protein
MNDAPSKKVPTAKEVEEFMRMYPRLDHLMAETLLMQSEEDLQKYLEEKNDSKE